MKLNFLNTLSLILLSACNGSNNECQLPEPQTIFYEEGKDKYIHSVLLEGYSRMCLDSLEVIKMAQKYASKVREGHPALIIRFYNSDKNFISGETSQPLHEINRSCLVIINLNEELIPYNFVFFDDQGNCSYYGPLWKPNSE